MLLRQVEKDQLTVALKGASDEVKALFFQNMSERAGKMMKEDMEAMGAVRLKDVDEARPPSSPSPRTWPTPERSSSPPATKKAN